MRVVRYESEREKRGWLETIHSQIASFQYQLGTMVAATDPQRTIALFTKAAQGGCIQAIKYLAGHYETGDLVAKNLHLALDLYKQGVSLNFPENHEQDLRDWAECVRRMVGVKNELMHFEAAQATRYSKEQAE